MVTSLTSPAGKGDKSIEVSSAEGWEVGAEIMLTTSSQEYKGHDKAKIVEVTGNLVKLDTELKHAHFGAKSPNSTTYGQIDLRTKVAYFKRTVHLKCRVQPFNYNDATGDAEGSIHLENVEMSECGTPETDVGCLVFRMVRKSTSLQTVKNCAIHDGKSYGLTANLASYFNVHNNVFHGFIEHNIEMINVDNFNFTSNIISYSTSRFVKSASPPQDEAFTFYK